MLEPVSLLFLKFCLAAPDLERFGHCMPDGFHLQSDFAAALVFTRLIVELLEFSHVQ